MYTQNDKQLRKSVQAFTRMLNENEWAEHAGHGDPDSSALETAITDLHNALVEAQTRIAELEKDGPQMLIINRPGMAPILKRPYGDLIAYTREVAHLYPDATITLVHSWGVEVGCQSVQDAREYLAENGA